MTRFAQVSVFAILCAMSSVAAVPVFAQGTIKPDAMKPDTMKSDAVHGKAMQHGPMAGDAMNADAMTAGPAKKTAAAKKHPVKHDAMQGGKTAPKAN